MEAITITLNGVEVSGYSGMTILNLARESGVDIPTLCDDPHLSPLGACRMCMVENEQNGALMAACVTPLAPGMVINTRSPRVVEHRKMIIKLMLASHPDSCLVCDKGNLCRLRQLAADMGIGWIELQRVPQIAVIQEVNPFIQRDLSKCILCGKCTRACSELVVEGIVDYYKRGFVTRPATLGDRALEDSDCTFCGTCVALCPTGALSERERPYRGTTSTMVQTTCPYCGCGCSLCLEVKDGRVVRARPGKEDTVNRSTLCVRGSYGYDFIHSPDRLTRPLVRTDKGFTETSWDKALEFVATELKSIKNEHGADSLAVFGSSKCTNEENYLLQRFARCVLGTNNIDNGSRLYNAATREGLGASIGFPGTTNQLKHLEQAEVLMVIGADVAASAPAVGYAIKRAVRYRGARLILIDPRRTGLANLARLWLRPRPGTDVVLLNSMAKVIIERGWLDEEFVTRKTDNFQALANALGRYSPEHAESATGVPAAEIETAACLYAKAGQAGIIYGSGVTQYKGGTDTVKAIANLALLTGNFGRGGGGIYALQQENNGQGACDMGALPDFLPGYHRVVDIQARNMFEEGWAVSLPEHPGLTALEMIEQAKAGKTRAMYITGENPVLSFPQSSIVKEALSSLEFLVVQDLFLTETARLAHVVLPSASFAEKEGTCTNFEGRVSRLHKAIEPLGESMPDWEIILQLAEKMKHPLPFSSLQQIMAEIEQLVPLYEGYAEPEQTYAAEQGEEEKREAYEGRFLKGFPRFYVTDYMPQPDGASRDYPFALLSGSTPFHFASGTRSSRAWRLKKFSPQAVVEIGQADAGSLALSDGEKVRLVSAAGEATATARITASLPEGMLFVPASFPEAPVAGLFSLSLDPETKTPLMKMCKVKIEKAGSNG